MAVRVSLVPLGHPEPDDLRRLARDLAAVGFRAHVATSEAIPERAYDAERGQYLADAFLPGLGERASERVLGVTEVDLYSPGLNFVLGIANTGGRAALISFARLRQGADERRFRERALKEAVHELGHALGLGHCPDPDCVMHFSNRLSDTDRKRGTYCATCFARLKDMRWPLGES